MSYAEDYFTLRETWRDWRIEAEHVVNLARVTKGSYVLEVGCGGGGLLRLLRAKGARAVGADVLVIALQLAHQRVSHVNLLRVGEGAELPFRAGTLDAIVGQHIIEHLPNADAALREWNRILKPGGRLALATPNVNYPDPAHFLDEDHTHVFSPQELCKAVENAGFSLETCYTIFPFLSRGRILRALGVIGHQVFRRTPYFAMRGRTIMLAAMKRPERQGPSRKGNTP